MCTKEFAAERLKYYEKLADELIATDTSGACLFGQMAEASIIGDILMHLVNAIAFYRCKVDGSLNPDAAHRKAWDEMKIRLIDHMEDGPLKRSLTSKYN